MEALIAVLVLVLGPLVAVAHADAKPTHCSADAAPFAVKLAARPDKSDPADTSKAYCDALTEQAEPLFKSASDKYQVCSDRAKQESISNDWSAWCDARLAILAPPKP